MTKLTSVMIKCQKLQTRLHVLYISAFPCERRIQSTKSNKRFV